jgi:hypothetical protein
LVLALYYFSRQSECPRRPLRPQPDDLAELAVQGLGRAPTNCTLFSGHENISDGSIFCGTNFTVPSE